MSFVKKPTMAERKIAANRANGTHSQGPATPEGKERMGAARRRQGFYAKPKGTPRDVKNGDRPGYVYENTNGWAKCILQECPFLHENAPNKRQLTEICRTSLDERAEPA